MGESCWVLFESSRPWLQRQAEMTSWEAGCARLAGLLDGWLDGYLQTLCDGPPAPSDAARRETIGRLWNCWSRHWQQAIAVSPSGQADGLEVAQRIRAGRGFVGAGALGGDPLRDLVLAVSVVHRDRRALAVFEKEYKEYAVAQAIRAHRPIAGEKHDWWCQFLDRLGGFSDPPGKLMQFEGKCGLKNWLGTVARRFAQPRVSSPRNWAPPPEPESEASRCLGLLASFARQSLERIAAESRLLLYLLFVREMPGNRVAAGLAVHPGTLTRRKETALSAWRQQMLQCVREIQLEEEYWGCLRRLFRQQSLSDFALLFFNALQQTADESPGETANAS